jgi:hypothetical protein
MPLFAISSVHRIDGVDQVVIRITGTGMASNVVQGDVAGLKGRRTVSWAGGFGRRGDGCT